MLVAFLVVLAAADFFLGKRRFVEAVLLTRSICDPLFELSKSSLDRSGIGLGAALNIAMIVTALAFIVSRPRVSLAMAAGLWLPFLAVALAAVPGAPDPSAALRLFLVIVSHAAFFILPFYLIEQPDDLKRYLHIMVLASIIPAIYAFLQLGLGWAETPDEGTRVAGTFSHPNVFAFYLLLVLTVVLYLLAARSFSISPRARRWLTLYIPVLLVLLVMTKTRSAWIAMAILMTVYAVRFDRRYLLYLLVAPLLALSIPGIADRFADLQQGNYTDSYAKLNSYAWRQLLWESSLVWAWERPLTGYGLEAFAYYVAEFFPLQLENGTIDSHSVYIQLIFETGLIGLAAFAWLFLRLLALMVALMRRGSAETLILMAMIVSYLIMAYADNMLYYLVPTWYFWFAMGGACAVLRTMAASSAAQPAARNTPRRPVTRTA